MIDTHCHLTLEPLKQNWQNILKEARDLGVQRFVNIGIDWPTSYEAYEQACQESDLFSTCGVHPDQADSNWQKNQVDFQNLMAQPRVVAIGEIGLDFFRKKNVEKQKECFHWFAKEAIRVNKPLVIHVRDAFDEIKEALRCYQNRLKGVIHCFTGSKQDVEDFVELGFYLSFSGIVTFKNAKDLQSAAEVVPLDRMLVETDSPYLAPTPHRGKTNYPKYVTHVIDFLADLKGLPREELEQQFDQNAQNLFQFDQALSGENEF
jgi:TatD DNase family protein